LWLLTQTDVWEPYVYTERTMVLECRAGCIVTGRTCYDRTGPRCQNV